jgi:hypothetical protein
MRIRTILAAAAAPAALAAGLLGTVAAPAAHAAVLTSASASAPATSNGQQGLLTGKNALVYQDAQFGWVKVNETQHPKFDTVSATFVTDATGKTPRVSTTFSPNYSSTVGWNSDFGTTYANTPSTDTSIHPGQGTLTYTINSDGTGYTGQVTY